MLNNSVKAGEEGVEIKTTRKAGGLSIPMAHGNNGCVFSFIKLIRTRNPLSTDRQWHSPRRISEKSLSMISKKTQEVSSEREQLRYI